MKTGNIKVNIVDGERNWLPAPHSVLLTLFRNGSDLAHRDFHDANAINLAFEVHDNLEDQFRVIAHTKNYSQSGFHPVQLQAANTAQVYLMLVPKNHKVDAAESDQGSLEINAPNLANLINGSPGLGGTNPRPNNRSDFDNLRKSQLEFTALLNISTAMNDISLPNPALDYYSRILWADLPGSTLRREHPQPDRFFGFADPQLLVEIRNLHALGKFVEEKDPARKGHPGATCSFKQKLFGEANIQLTFHEKTVDPGNQHIMVEADMDFFDDQISHFFLEVIPNKITGGKTNPLAIYVMRWMAAKQTGRDFKPPYKIQAAS